MRMRIDLFRDVDGDVEGWRPHFDNPAPRIWFCIFVFSGRASVYFVIDIETRKLRWQL